MKRIYTLLTLIILSTSALSAQVTTVVAGLDDSDRLLLVNDLLYFSQANDIAYIDITEINPTPTVLISGLNNPVGLEIKDDFLYIAHFGDGDVIKVDLNDPTPSVIDVTFFGNTPNMLKFNGNDLYFTDNNGDRIYKYDITSGTPEAEIFLITPSGPVGIEIKDGFLYYNQPLLGNILKIDVTQSTPIIEDVVINLDNPRDITFDGDILYICELNKISKIDLSLSVDEQSIDNITLYPNPTKESLNIANLRSNLKFTIHDVNGRVLKQGTVSPDQQIDVSALAQGCYFLSLNNLSVSTTLKFIKD
ncbi:T9SS type A sorting domain-containing protein [Psychroserpens algicola]|uniref:T9SS type A sorting domain-containing protein n=1 Tax=Psychroserpens algicola TaxID=1719034 RepID=A0ABT0HEE5_9FLAO|nr:T9SS type A sorting domain-containing protein [Psychroserpens algicola]MCK8482230.1 T9SS type A sorting domain-containing protein [Psychroserpens algicola]